MGGNCVSKFSSSLPLSKTPLPQLVDSGRALSLGGLPGLCHYQCPMQGQMQGTRAKISTKRKGKRSFLEGFRFKASRL